MFSAVTAGEEAATPAFGREETRAAPAKRRARGENEDRIVYVLDDGICRMSTRLCLVELFSLICGHSTIRFSILLLYVYI